MSLTLQVVGPSSQKLGGEAVRSFSQGGSIGRADSNDWVLPDPERFISSNHAVIEFRGGGYVLIDNSVNGTYVNAAEQPLGFGNTHQIVDGDRIIIGEYEIVASLAVAEQPSAEPAWPEAAPASRSLDVDGPGIGLEQKVDPLELLNDRPGADLGLGITPSAGQQPDPFASSGPGPAGYFKPPETSVDPLAPRADRAPEGFDDAGGGQPMPAAGVPEDWDKTSFSSPDAAPPEAPNRPDPRGADPFAAPPAPADPFAEPVPPQASPEDPFQRPPATLEPQFAQPTPAPAQHLDDPAAPPGGVPVAQPEAHPGIPPLPGQPNPSQAADPGAVPTPAHGLGQSPAEGLPGRGIPGHTVPAPGAPAQPDYPQHLPGQEAPAGPTPIVGQPPTPGGQLPPHPGLDPGPAISGKGGVPPHLGQPPGQQATVPVGAPPQQGAPPQGAPPQGAPGQPAGLHGGPQQGGAPAPYPPRPGQQPPPQGYPPQAPPHAAPPAEQNAYPPASAALPVDAAGMVRLLQVAGLDENAARALAASPEVGDLLGYLLRILVQGLMDLLNARAEIKNEFRVNRTQIRPHENNPLKFCVDANDAMYNLLVKQNQGGSFLDPVSAFQEAIDDMKAHQMAMMAGMRAAFEQLMRDFDPVNLQELFDGELRRNMIGGLLNKNKYWDMLCERFEGNRDRDSNFERLFGDPFARAYEEQMGRLSNARRGGH